MVTRVQIYFCLAFLAFPPSFIEAQSTSPWQRISDPSFGISTAATPGSGYLSVIVRAASMYQSSNFWTGSIENHRQGVVTANLNASIAGVSVAQTITGSPIELHKNNSMVDLGFAGAVVDHLPNTFSGMSMTIQINKTSQDGLQSLITQVSQLSTGTPPVLSLSPETLALTSLSKSLADFLFKSNLLVKKASTQNVFPGGGLVPPGIYVSFAADSSTEYSQYLTDSANLKWSGSVLTYKDQAINKVGFFVIEVAYQHSYFADPHDALSSTIVPWVQLYQVAEGEISSINTAQQAVSVSNDVQSHLADARTLLSKDPTLIQSEKEAIDNSESERINNKYKARLVALGLAQAEPSAVIAGTSTPSNPSIKLTQLGESQPGLRPVLKAPDPALDTLHLTVAKSLGVGTQMKPTSKF